MKRIAIMFFLAVVLVNTAFTQVNKTSVMLSNKHKIEVMNLLNERFQEYFDNTALAKAFDAISSTYGLSTDFLIGFNPTDKMLWLTIQGIKFNPAKVIAMKPYKNGANQYLPLDLQSDCALAVRQWAESFVTNEAAPEDVRAMLKNLMLKSTRFQCSLESESCFLVASGDIIGSSVIRFDPKLQWQDLKTPFFATIKMPQTDTSLAMLYSQRQMLLENPDDPSNPTFKKESVWVFIFFGLR